MRTKTLLRGIVLSLSLAPLLGVMGGCARSRETHTLEPLPSRDETFPAIWPVAALSRTVTSEFGDARPGGRHHTGIDVAAPVGTPVLVTASGRVQFAGTHGGFGLLVVVSHAGALETAYAHLDTIAVQAKQAVVQGQMIGRSGCSGNATGPHVHYEVREDGRPVNPRPFLP